MNSFPTHRLLTLLLSACAAFFPLARAHAQQVVNGSFELDTASSTTPNPGTGWMSQSSPPLYYVYNNSFGHGSTPYGSQWLYLQSGQVSQTIAGPFVAGQPYELQFSAADIQGGTTPRITATAMSGTTILAQTTYVLSPFTSYASNAPIKFVVCALDFVPTTNGPITISIGSPNYPVAIDNAVFVPEPSTWVLLGVGAAVLGVSVRRRRQMIA